MKININLITVTLLIPFFLIGQNKDSQVEEVIKNYLSPNGSGLAILVTQNQNVLYEKAFGLSNISTSEKIQPDHLFRIGSITKQFTAVAILKLAHNKKLHLEDPINKYISSVTSSEKITIKQLLTHTSGLGNQSDLPAFDKDSIDLNNYPRGIIESILSSSLKFSPGTNYAYSNLGYIVLGDIIERISGLSYEQYLNKIFFEPLHMKNTGFEYYDDPVMPTSKGYSVINGQYEESDHINMKIAYSAGALVSNLHDLQKWNSAIMSGKVLPLSYKSQLQESGYLPNGQSTGYSLGWQIGNIQGLKSVKHDGIVNGFTSMAIYLPEIDLYVSTLSNCDCFRDIELPASKIAALFAEKPFPSQSDEISINDYEKFQGKYRNGDSEMIIRAHDNILMYYRAGGVKEVLIPTGENKFQIKGSLDQIAFHFKKSENTYSLRSLNDITHWKRIEHYDAYNSIPLSHSEIEEYVGQYQVAGAFVFEVIRDGDKIYGQIGNDRKEIFCYDTDKFCALNLDALLELNRDQQGKVVELNFIQGKKIKAQRIK